jgi:magnesium transporter
VAQTRTRLYRDGQLVAEDFPVEEISDHLGDERVAIWLDLCEPTQADFDAFAEELGLHALAVEDALDPGQRPKVDRYKSHLFVSAYDVSLDADQAALTTREIGIFVTPQAIVTVRRDEGFDMDAVVAVWDANPDLARFGTAYLLHGILDRIVDGHLAAMEELDSALEGIEDLLFDVRRPPVKTVQRRSYRLRKSLVHLRKVVLPMRELVNALMRPTMHVVGDDMLPYYHDVYDHVLRAIEWTDSLRDLVTTILETNLTVQGNRMNLIMKKVTSWAAIIAVPTAVTGFYGMNVPYPGYDRFWGFLVATVLIVVLSVGLYVQFRRSDWL